MAALPANSTARFRVFYTTASKQHSFQIRSGSSPGAIGTLVGMFLAAHAGAIFTLVIDNVDWAAAGSNVFNPVTTGIEGNTYGSGTPAGDVRAWALNYIGRTPGGRRVRIMVFSPTLLGGDYRFVSGEGTALDAARAVLVGAGSAITGIDGQTPVWKTYINALANAHWQKALRP
jgi:hypothetical protein